MTQTESLTLAYVRAVLRLNRVADVHDLGADELMHIYHLLPPAAVSLPEWAKRVLGASQSAPEQTMAEANEGFINVVNGIDGK